MFLLFKEALGHVLKCRKVQPQIKFLNEITDKLVNQKN